MHDRSFTVQHDISDDSTKLQDGEYVYDSDADDLQTLVHRFPQSSSTDSTGTAALTTIRASIALGYLVEPKTAPIVLGNSVTNTAPLIAVAHNTRANTAPLIAAANILETGILK